MTIVLLWANLTPRSIHIGTPARAKGSILLPRSQGVVLSAISEGTIEQPLDLDRQSMIPDWVSFFPPLTLLLRCHRYPPRWWTRGFQIQTSCSAVRSPPASPVLSTPRGSIRSNLTSFSA
jgi:hypothetical protein